MDMKDRMIEAYERGECSYEGAYDHVRETLADGADQHRKAEREAPAPTVEELMLKFGFPKEGEE